MAQITGTSGNDRLIGTAGADTMSGLGGNDTFVGGSGGADVIDGGTGFDTIEFGSAAPSAVIVDFRNGTITGGGTGSISFTSIERVVGSNFNDSLTGNAAGQNLTGQAGADTLWGAGGVDTLWGGGGAGDTFVFRETGTANADFISDFTSAVDRIQLDAAVMTALGASGNFAAGDARFWAAAGATGGHDADDRVIYDTTTRKLYYDADGSGSGAAQLIATLQSGATLAATDIAVEGGSSGGGGQVVNGTAANDSLTGGPGNDTINGLAGNDSLAGGEGNDVLDGGLGSDTLIGGADADLFRFSERELPKDPPDYDRILDFASGTDKIQLDGNVFQALGAAGDFSAGDPRFHVGWDGIDSAVRVIYDPSSGFLFYDFDGSGTGFGTIFAALPGKPALSATDFTVINAQSGPRTIIGTAGDDLLVGDQGNDTINGLGGDDRLWGVGGNDSLIGGDGNDLVDGGNGDDTLIGNAGTNTYFGGAGNDMLIGGSGNEEFYPGEGNDRVEAGAGDNVVWEGKTGWDGDQLEFGNDTLVGGTASDTLHFHARSNVVVDMRSGTLSGGSQSGGGSIAFSGFEAFGFWGEFSVHFTADDTGVRVFANGGGDDTLKGGAGDDVLYGGVGNNLFVGGAGADTMYNETDQGIGTFVFNTAPVAGSADTIFSFVTGVYSLHFDASVFTALGAPGNFSAGDGRFYSADGATQGHDATDRLIYNSSNGDLWYDADGNGPGAALLVATLPRDTGGGDFWSVADTDIWVDGTSGGGQVINGTGGNDTLIGGTGNDTINGFAGNDSLDGGEGADSLVGGEGNDTLFNPDFGHGDGSADTLDGGLGDDVYYVSDIWSDGDVILADPGGVDTVIARNTDWTLGAGLNNLDLADSVGSAFNGTGNELDNVIRSAWEGGTLSGLGGNDLLIARHVQNTARLVGGDGNDTLVGTGNHVVMFGDGGNDSLTGSAVEDELDGGAGVDTMNGGEGDDLYTVTAGDVLSDSGGIDLVRTDVNWSLGADFEHLTMTGTASIQMQGNNSDNFVAGNSGNNYFNARAGSDTIQAGAGNDSIDMSSSGTGNHGNDVIDGGAGFDNIDYDGYATTGIIANWTSGTISGGDAAGSTVSFTSVEAIVGGGSADQMTGNASGQNLTGKGGNDTLWGAGGADTLWGGTGADSFVFREMGAANADRIGDFASGSDKISLDDASFAAIGAAGNFAAGDGRFWAAAGAASGHDANDRVIYNTSTGSLYYDADGSGAGAAQLIATFTGNPAMTATDITVI